MDRPAHWIASGFASAQRNGASWATPGTRKELPIDRSPDAATEQPADEASSEALTEFSSVERIEDLVHRVQAGDHVAAGELLESYRNYLRAIAHRRMSAPLNRRIDASDLVQETMLEAHRGLAAIITDEESHLRATLRKILTCNVMNAIRDHLNTEKRQAGRECALQPYASHHAGSLTTPSRHLEKQETQQRFVRLLDDLPEDQATAIRMRYFEAASVADIGEALGRSRPAAAGLLKRGLAQLRQQLSQDAT